MSFILLLVLPGVLHAQQDGLLQIRDDVHAFLLRQQAEGHLPEAFLSHLPLSAYEAREYLDHLEKVLRGADLEELHRLRGTLSSPGTASGKGWLFRNGRDFFHTEGPGYALQINPLLYLSVGRAWETQSDTRQQRTTLQHARGFRISGHLGEHLFFESRLTENLTSLPPLARERLRQRIPAAYENRSYLPAGGFDYWQVTGMLGIRLPFVELRIGRDQNQWGPGLGSLLLSDYAPTYDQVQIRTTFWRIQYVNLYGLMTDPYRQTTPGGAYVPRFISAHHLTLRLHRRLQLGIYESVTLDPDTFSSRAQMLLAFLNPLIFYRAVDFSLRSPGNMLIGFDGYWQTFNGLALYGQFLLDEFVWSELTGGKGWWANKWGIVGGLYLTRLPLQGMDLRIEGAIQRPYLYSSRSTTLSYTHFNGTLGYPTGPNSRSLAMQLSYRRGKGFLRLLTVFLQQGRNGNGKNYGADPIEPYTTRVADYGIHLLQGIRQDSWHVEAETGLELFPRLVLSLTARYQYLRDAEEGISHTFNPAFLLRWGLPYQSVFF